jgi:hypothetical protein
MCAVCRVCRGRVWLWVSVYSVCRVCHVAAYAVCAGVCRVAHVCRVCRCVPCGQRMRGVHVCASITPPRTDPPPLHAHHIPHTLPTRHTPALTTHALTHTHSHSRGFHTHRYPSPHTHTHTHSHSLWPKTPHSQQRQYSIQTSSRPKPQASECNQSEIRNFAILTSVPLSPLSPLLSLSAPLLPLSLHQHRHRCHHCHHCHHRTVRHCYRHVTTSPLLTPAPVLSPLSPLSLLSPLLPPSPLLPLLPLSPHHFTGASLSMVSQHKRMANRTDKISVV